MTQGFVGAGQTDAPLMLAQRIGAKNDLVSRAQELVRVRVSQRAADGSYPTAIRQKRADSAA